MRVEIKVKGADEYRKRLERKAREINANLAKWVLEAALIVEGQIRKTVIQTFTGNPTGNLARSFKARMLSTARGGIAAGVFSDLPYAGIHDQGGTILPRSVSRLAVPISNRARGTRGLWPRHWPRGSLFAIKSRAGNIILAEKVGAGIRPHYVLKPSVKITGRQYLKRASDIARPRVVALLGDRVKLAVERR